ncbi:MAG: RNA-binding protein, partial [Methylocella sp.]
MPIGPKGQKRPRDANQLAKLIVDIATGQVEDREPTSVEQGKTLDFLAPSFNYSSCRGVAKLYS